MIASLRKRGKHMAHIKCRYHTTHCMRDGYRRIDHDERWFCDSDECCENYIRPYDAKVSNPECVNCYYRNGEFEKTIKRYEYDEDGGLILSKGEYYNPLDIDYLEIDGRILVGGDDHE